MTFQKKNSFYGIIIFLIFLSYFVLNNPNTGFFSDDYNWLSRYEKLGFNGLWTNYNDQFYLPLTYLLQLFEWILFEDNYLGYFFVNSSVFVFSMFIFYELLQQIKSQFEFPNYWPEIIVLFVLVSPYNTEVLKWYSSQSYLFSVFFVITAYYFYFKFKKTNQRIHFFLLSCSFLISIFFKEISLIFPLSILFIEMTVFRKKVNIQLLFILFFLLILYFCLRKMFLGDLIGGYGSEIHLDFSVHKIFIGIAAYIAKFFFLYRYKLGFYFMTVFILFVFFILIKRKNKRIFILFSLLVFLFFISLIPVINLEISFLDSIQSDRYGYLPGIFASIILGTAVTLLIDKNLVLLLSLNIGLIQLYYLNQTLMHWSKAKEFKNEFIQSVKQISANNPSFILLNIPDNYNGVYIFRNGFEQNQKLYFPNNQIKVGVLHQTCYKDTLKVKIENSNIQISSSLGKFLHYVRTSFKPININSNNVVFSLKDKTQTIYLFNNSKLEKISLFKR